MGRNTNALVVVIAGALALAACAGDGTGGTDTPPAAPTNVMATPGPGYVDVTWEHDGARVTGFTIERRQLDDTGTAASSLSDSELVIAPRPAVSASSVTTHDAAEVGTVGAEARAFRDEAVEAGVSYRYGVRAVGSGGSTSSTSETPAEGVSPQPPGGTIGSNPDPSRFLAAIVRDGAAPVDNAIVAGFLVEHGDTLDPHRMTATSGDAGVALMIDRQDVEHIPDGTYDVLVSAWLPSTRTYALTVVEDVPFPGTFEVDLSDAAFTEIAMDLNPAEASRAWVEFGRDLRGWTLYGRFVDLHDDAPVTLLLEPLVYDSVIVLDWAEAEATYIVGTLDLASASTLTIAAEVPSVALVTLDPAPAPLPLGVDLDAYACVREPRITHRHMSGPCMGTGAFNTVPWTAEIIAGVYIDLFDAIGEEWLFEWFLDERVMGSADIVVTYGGAIDVTVATDAATYQPGDTVALTGVIEDAFGNPKRRAQATFNGTTEPVHANLEVFDPDGTRILDRWEVAALSDEPGSTFDLPPTAVPGTYTLQYTYPTGPYQGDIVATTTFEVVHAPDPDLIVSGERVGDLISIGAPRAVVDAMPGSETTAVPRPDRTSYTFRDEEDAFVFVINVCVSSDAVSEVYVFNHPDNERFVTPEGLSVTSSENEVLAALGAPDRTLEASSSRIHDYDPIVGDWYGRGFSFWFEDTSRAHWIGVRGSCE